VSHQLGAESARPSPFLGRKVCSGSFCSLGRYGICPLWWILSFKKARKPAKSPHTSYRPFEGAWSSKNF